MGFRTKSRARKLPELIKQLESGRAQVAQRDQALEDAGQQTDERREAGESLSQSADDYIERARAYRDEFQANGSITDGEFDSWFKTARAFASIANMSPEEFRQVSGLANRLPGG